MPIFWLQDLKANHSILFEYKRKNLNIYASLFLKIYSISKSSTSAKCSEKIKE